MTSYGWLHKPGIVQVVKFIFVCVCVCIMHFICFIVYKGLVVWCLKNDIWMWCAIDFSTFM